MYPQHVMQWYVFSNSYNQRDFCIYCLLNSSSSLLGSDVYGCGIRSQLVFGLKHSQNLAARQRRRNGDLTHGSYRWQYGKTKVLRSFPRCDAADNLCPILN